MSGRQIWRNCKVVVLSLSRLEGLPHVRPYFPQTVCGNKTVFRQEFWWMPANVASFTDKVCCPVYSLGLSADIISCPDSSRQLKTYHAQRHVKTVVYFLSSCSRHLKTNSLSEDNVVYCRLSPDILRQTRFCLQTIKSPKFPMFHHQSFGVERKKLRLKW